MKWTHKQQLENESKAKFRSLIPREWIVRDKVPDVGIDMEIEFVKNEEVQNKLLLVQIKATESMKTGKAAIPFMMETKHLKYYENAQLPVIILLWRKPENSFYYLFAQKFIQEELSPNDQQWRRKRKKVVVFPPSSKLTDPNSLYNLATEAYFYIIQQQLNIKPQAGSAIYWLDGVPRSDDEELKEGMLRAFSWLVKERYRDAISELERVSRICTVSPKQKMVISLSLGNAYYSLDEIDRALESFNDMIEISKKVDGKDVLIGKSYAMGNMGLICALKGDFENSLRLQKEVLRIGLQLADKATQAIALSNIAMVLRTQGNLDDALKYEEDALEIDKALGRRKGEAASLCNLGVIYEERGELDKALTYFAEALKISCETGFQCGEANALGNIGVIYASKGDAENAHANYLKALEIYREIGDKKSEANVLCNIGLIRGDEFLDESLKDFKKALRIEKKIGHKKGEGSALGNIGFVYLQKYDLDRAFASFSAALKIDKEIGYRQGEATDLSDMGLVFKARGELDVALKFFSDALEIDRQIQNRKGEIDDLYFTGLIHMEKGDLFNALRNLIEASNMADKYKIVVFRDSIQSAINSIASNIQRK